MSRLPAAAVVLAVLALSVAAGEIELKDGTVLRGKVRPLQSLSLQVTRSSGELTTYPIIQVYTPLRRYMVPSRNVVRLNNDADLDRLETFVLSTKKSRSSTQIQSLGFPKQIGSFDDRGRRKLVFEVKGRPLHVYQSVTKLTPQFATVVANKYAWTHGIATNALDPDVLDRWLRGVTDPENLDDRLAIARFYLQADRYRQAGRELAEIGRKFPGEQKKVGPLQARLDELIGQKVLDELKRRRDSGQHTLFRRSLRQFPVEELSSNIRRQVRELLEADREAVKQRTRAVRLLADQLKAVVQTGTRQSLQPAIEEISRKLDLESLDRLDAFLRFADDATLKPAEKLALAVSGWLIGSGQATTNPREAATLWTAQKLLLDAVRAEPADRPAFVSRLESLEGISPKRVSQLVKLLPPILATPNLASGVPRRITIGKRGGGYWVMLPPEYNPHHRYPLLVVLHDSGGTPQGSLTWWAGTAQKPRPAQQRGYIVIAPELPGVRQPGSSPADRADKEATVDLKIGPSLHQAVHDSLVDARLRFRIDSDRTVLAGHGQGGNAAFEIGMSHPDWFAGVVPIAAAMNDYCTYYWRNAENLPWYVINGELDRPRVESNAMGLNRMLRHRFPLIYCEYVGRGYEAFTEEIFGIFDWIGRLRRARDPKEIQVGTLRATDNRFFWVRMEELPLTRTRGTRKRPLRLTARITPGNSISINSAAASVTLWFSPDLVDFERRAPIKINGRRRQNEFLTPNIAHMIDDLRQRGDREKLYWLRLEFD